MAGCSSKTLSAAASSFFERDREHDPLALQREDPLLEGHERLALGAVPEPEPRRPVVAHDPAPEGVVEVEHEAFPRQAQVGGDDCRGVPGEERERVESDRLLREEPVAVVEPPVLPERAGEPVAVDEQDVVPGRLPEGRVQRGEHRLARARHPEAEVPERRIRPQRECVLHDPCARPRPERPPPVRLAGDVLLGRFASVRQPRGALVDCEHDVRRREPVQFARGIEKLLLDLVEPGVHELGADAERMQGEAQHGGELVGRVRPEDGHARVPLRDRSGIVGERREEPRGALPRHERVVCPGHALEPAQRVRRLSPGRVRAGDAEAELPRRDLIGAGGLEVGGERVVRAPRPARYAPSSPAGAAITRGGGANTVAPAGTSIVTTQFGPIVAPSPISMPP